MTSGEERGKGMRVLLALHQVRVLGVPGTDRARALHAEASARAYAYARQAAPALTPPQERVLEAAHSRVPVGSTPTGSEPAFKRALADVLLEALKRDLDTLAGPPRVPWPCPEADRPLYEGRIADYRARLRSMVD